MTMTFDEQESSHESGKPILLFHIRYGVEANSYYAYTNAEEPVLYGGVSYVPEVIKHSGIKQSGSLDNASVTMNFPHDTPISVRFRGWPPSEVISVVIRQGHADNPQFPVVFSGRVLSSKLNDNEETEFALERVNTSLMRPGLRRKYGRGCPLLVYSQGPFLCNADREAATDTVSVTSVNGSQVVLGGSWTAKANKDKYKNGIAAWTTGDGRAEKRSIIDVGPGNTVLLGGPAFGLLPAMNVQVTYGCDHLLDGDCDNLHNNAQNFGGQWLIPLENPIGLKNNFY